MKNPEIREKIKNGLLNSEKWKKAKEENRRGNYKKNKHSEEIKKIISKINIPLVVSGGVSNIKDVQQLDKFGLFDGVIIGKAIYDKSIFLSELKKFV